MSKIDKEEVFKQLKKHHGEKFAQAIRGDFTHDVDLCTVPNIVHILEFAGNSKDDALALRPIIKEIFIPLNERPVYHTDKSPLELLSDAGYDAFVVETEEQKDSIKKYYRPGEELCTFRDPTRQENYYIIHAVKRGAENIKPSDIPQREDEYGTSVISIQISKTGGFISIKNRYNHTVNNPDATFNNNPDKIIPGLTSSLKQYFGVDFNTSQSIIPDNYRLVNDQLVHFNYEIENVYFGADYYFSGSDITKIDKDHQIFLDYFILDTKSGAIIDPSDIGHKSYGSDCAGKIFSEIFKGKRIKIEINPENKKERIIFADDLRIAVVNDNGNIVELNLPDIFEIGNSFLHFDDTIKKLDMSQVEEIGENFMQSNRCLMSLHAPRLKSAKKDFLTANIALTELDLPNVEDIGQYSLQMNNNLVSINMPKVEDMGHLSPLQPKLKHFYAPNLPDDRLDWWAKNSPDIAVQIAKVRLHRMIDEQAEAAKEKLNKIARKYHKSAGKE